MKIVENILCYDSGASVRFVKSPNYSVRKTKRMKLVVMHFTAGQNADSAISWLASDESSVSAHLVIGRDGGVTQLVPFNMSAWHAGKSSWKGETSINSCSIGIELDNCGKLVKTPNGWKTTWGAKISQDSVVELQHKNEDSVGGWQTYTKEQLDAAVETVAAIVVKYGDVEIVGHDDIAPCRKNDPGPAFPMEQFKLDVMAKVGKQLPQQPIEGVVGTAIANSDVNCRSGPGTEYDVVRIVKKDEAMDIYKWNWHWAHVKLKDGTIGWINDKYIDSDMRTNHRSKLKKL